MLDTPVTKISVVNVGTKTGEPDTNDAVMAVSFAKGWLTIGYHWMVSVDGLVTKGLDEDLPSGAGDEGVILVGCTGSKRTDSQTAALTSLMAELTARYPSATVSGFSATAPAPAAPVVDKTPDPVTPPEASDETPTKK